MREPVHIVMQSYGQPREYLRTIFAIWSFYAHVPAAYSATKTLLYTDDPEYFRHYLEGLPIEYVLLTADGMRRMRGEHDFLHRMKIAIIEDAFHRSQSHLLYMDGDAFFTADPSPMLAAVNEKTSFMHTDEYPFVELLDMPLPSGAPFHAVVKYLEERDLVMADGTARRFSTQLHSWNAGVIALHREQATVLPDVYAITDQLYAATRNHASEQYAFSIVLQRRTELRGCEPFIYHYWYRIKKQIADAFFQEKLDAAWSRSTPERKRAAILEWCRSFPSYFDQHRLTLRDNAIQAFNANSFKTGYAYALRSFARNPFDTKFLRDVAYHTRRYFSRDKV